MSNNYLNVTTSNSGNKSPSNFSIPRYADKLKDMMAKS